MKEEPSIAISSDQERSLLINTRQLAKWLIVTTRTIRSKIADGKLPKSIRVGNSHRWFADEIEAWMHAKCPPQDEWEAIKRRRASLEDFGMAKVASSQDRASETI